MNKLSNSQKRLIKKHNAKMKVISDTAKANGISQATLFYAAQHKIIGIPWIIKKRCKHT